MIHFVNGFYVEFGNREIVTSHVLFTVPCFCQNFDTVTVCMDDNVDIVIVAFLENATIEYSSASLCVCVRVCVWLCVCFSTITQKEIDLGT